MRLSLAKPWNAADGFAILEVMSALSLRKKFVILSACLFMAGFAGVFFMGPLGWFKALLGLGFVSLILSIASLVGRGYFSTAVIMAGIALVIDPAQVFTIEGDIEGRLILKASNLMEVFRAIATLAAITLFGIGLYHRFGRRTARIYFGSILGAGLLLGITAFAANEISGRYLPQYQEALNSCAMNKLNLAAEKEQQGLYKYLSTRRDAWHLCAVDQTCGNALCRASFAIPTRFLDTLRAAGDRVIIAETAGKYDAVLQVCAQRLSDLAGAEDVEAYVNARPHDPVYAERIDWDLLGCASSTVCEQYAEQSGVRQATCEDAYRRMRETGSLSPTLEVMRKFGGEKKE